MPPKPPQTASEVIADLTQRVRLLERQFPIIQIPSTGCCECVGGRRYLSDTTKSIPNNTNQGVAFDSTKLLTGGITTYDTISDLGPGLSQAGGPGLVIPAGEAGAYIASIGIAWSGGSNVGYRQARIWCYDPADNSTAIFVSETRPALPAAGPSEFVAWSTILHPRDGWCISAEVVQNSGSAQTIYGDDLGHATFLEIQKIAPCDVPADVFTAPPEE